MNEYLDPVHVSTASHTSDAVRQTVPGAAN